MPYQFTVIIERDLESNWLVGSVAELPGCYTHAADMIALEKNMREAIELYLATVDEDNQGPRVQVALMRLKEEIERKELRESAELYAAIYDENTELQELTERAIEGWPE